MFKVVASLVALSVASAASATTTISFGTPGGSIGTTHTYSAEGLSLTASGFDASGEAVGLFGKNAGGDEVGLGLVNDPSGDHEIYQGKGFVQLDVSQLLGKVSMITFFTNSTTGGEQWSIFGSNIAGSYAGSAILTGTNESTGTLPGLGKYKYYDFASTSGRGGKNFLIGGVTLTGGVPEPATWALMLFGIGAIGAGMRRRSSQRALRMA